MMLPPMRCEKTLHFKNLFRSWLASGSILFCTGYLGCHIATFPLPCSYLVGLGMSCCTKPHVQEHLGSDEKNKHTVKNDEEGQDDKGNGGKNDSDSRCFSGASLWLNNTDQPTSAGRERTRIPDTINNHQNDSIVEEPPSTTQGNLSSRGRPPPPCICTNPSVIYTGLRALTQELRQVSSSAFRVDAKVNKLSEKVDELTKIMKLVHDQLCNTEEPTRIHHSLSAELDEE